MESLNRETAGSVLVTGCSIGFGQEIALALAERGFRVYATMRDLARRARLDAEAARRHVELRALKLDVCDEGSIRAAVQTIVDETGGIDGVVNNAGLLLRGYFEDLLEDEIRQVFETNFFGTLAVTRAVLPHMRTAGRGRVLVMSSVAGKIGSPSGSAYSASRFALEGFAESLRQEMEPFGVYVSVIAPGITKTERWTSDRGAGARSADPNSPYYARFKRAEALFDRMMQTSPITAADVAQVAHRALTDRRPRYRYQIGSRAKLVLSLRRVLPGELFERVYFGLAARLMDRSQ